MGTRASEEAARQGRPISKPVRLGKSARTSLEQSPALSESLATSQSHSLAIRIPRRARPEPPGILGTGQVARVHWSHLASRFWGA